MEKVEFKLPGGKILLKPVLRDGGWLQRGHSGHWMYDETVHTIVVPIDANTGYLKEVLTPDEREFFENPAKSGLDFKTGDLLATKIKDNFWKKYELRVSKPETVATEETVLLELDLNKPIDYIKYKVLLANTSPAGGAVAPSWADKYNSGTYKMVLVEEADTTNEVVTKAMKKEQAYKYFGKIKSSAEELYNTLFIYWLQSRSYKRPSIDQKLEFYIAELDKIIDTDLDGFMEIVNNLDSLEYKVLIIKGINSGVIRYAVNDGFITIDGIPLGLTLDNSVKYLKDERNQEIYFKIQNYIESYKK
jgi:hypothetical protein